MYAPFEKEMTYPMSSVIPMRGVCVLQITWHTASSWGVGDRACVTLPISGPHRTYVTSHSEVIHVVILHTHVHMWFEKGSKI